MGKPLAVARNPRISVVHQEADALGKYVELAPVKNEAAGAMWKYIFDGDVVPGAFSPPG